MASLHDRMQAEISRWKSKYGRQATKMADQVKEQKKRGRAGK